MKYVLILLVVGVELVIGQGWGFHPRPHGHFGPYSKSIDTYDYPKPDKAFIPHRPPPSFYPEPTGPGFSSVHSHGHIGPHPRGPYPFHHHFPGCEHPGHNFGGPGGHHGIGHHSGEDGHFGKGHFGQEEGHFGKGHFGQGGYPSFEMGHHGKGGHQSGEGVPSLGGVGGSQSGELVPNLGSVGGGQSGEQVPNSSGSVGGSQSEERGNSNESGYSSDREDSGERGQTNNRPSNGNSDETNFTENPLSRTTQSNFWVTDEKTTEQRSVQPEAEFPYSNSNSNPTSFSSEPETRSPRVPIIGPIPSNSGNNMPYSTETPDTIPVSESEGEVPSDAFWNNFIDTLNSSTSTEYPQIDIRKGNIGKRFTSRSQ